MAELDAFAKLGEILVHHELIDDSQLARGLEEAQEKGILIGEALIGLGFAIEENVYLALAHQASLPFFSNDDLLETKEDVVRLVPEAFAKQNNVLAVRKNDSVFKLRIQNRIKLT